jgi:hypothetical protein
MTNNIESKKFVLMDLDNCLSDDGWRIKYIDPGLKLFDRYHKYHSLSPFDDFPLTAQDLIDSIKENIIIVTARPDMFRHSTEYWLTAKGINFSRIIMRQTDVHGSSVDLKRQAVNKLLFNINIEDIVCCYDDRPDVLQMYENEFGFKAVQHKIHDIQALESSSVG